MCPPCAHARNIPPTPCVAAKAKLHSITPSTGNVPTLLHTFAVSAPRNDAACAAVLPTLRAALQSRHNCPQICNQPKQIRIGCLPAQRRRAGMSVLHCFRARTTLRCVNDSALRPSLTELPSTPKIKQQSSVTNPHSETGTPCVRATMMTCAACDTHAGISSAKSYSRASLFSRWRAPAYRTTENVLPTVCSNGIKSKVSVEY